MNYEYALTCVIASSLGSIAGNIIINGILKKSNKLSILIYVLGTVSLLSTIVIPLQSLLEILKDINQGKNIMIFNNPCK
jgi:hypothetical protein